MPQKYIYRHTHPHVLWYCLNHNPTLNVGQDWDSNPRPLKHLPHGPVCCWTNTTHTLQHKQVTINSIMVNCARGIEVDTFVRGIPSISELTAVNLQGTLVARGLQVTFDGRRRMKEVEVKDGYAHRMSLLHDPAFVAAAREDSLTTEAEEGGAGVGGEAAREKQSKRRFESRQELASVFSSDCISLSASVVAGGADSLEEAVDAASDRNLLSTTEKHSVKTVAASAFARTFIVVLPYTVEEFTADVQIQFKNAVAKTAGVSTEKVFALSLLPLLSLWLLFCVC